MTKELVQGCHEFDIQETNVPINHSHQADREHSALDTRQQRTYSAMVCQMSENKTKAASGLLICNYNGHKVTNTNLPPSNIDITSQLKWLTGNYLYWKYTCGHALIEVVSFNNVVALRNRALEGQLDESIVELLACQGEILGLEKKHQCCTELLATYPPIQHALLRLLLLQ
ncbi:hypothetical protein EDD18DRAFT_1110567 [Armillaria luteobubalina]|uniref:Uncharacterized protein n=1 Tax=Armillaria luteobubalina TaxID=153913 RepID=A0AA39PPW2_9AGAR|nr:hypothetical protein EDD18DRAFT_1110567 [Armillaria luteobubalina]